MPSTWPELHSGTNFNCVWDISSSLGWVRQTNAVKYSGLAKAGKIQTAYANVTSPVAFSATVGIGGPLLWNPPTSTVEAHILMMSVAVDAVSKAVGTLGICGAGGQNTAPTSTTASDASGCSRIGAPQAAVQSFDTGTVSVASTEFLPIIEVGKNVTPVTAPSIFDLGGIFVCPPGSWLAVAGSTVLASGIFQIGLVWAVLPV